MPKYIEPWEAIENPSVRAALEHRLQKELTEGHVLTGRSCQAVARTSDDDDVLFEIDGGPKFAIVHLTYSKPTSPDFPFTEIYNPFEEFAEAMKHWGDDAVPPDEDD